MTDYYEGKLALVTGGSSGIGLAAACELAARGADVWILARDPLKLQRAFEQINKARKNASQRTGTIRVDLKDHVAVKEALDTFQTEVGVPDLLLNSAGLAHPGLVEELCAEIYREMIEANYLGTVHAVSAVLPGMITRKSGQIINFASGAGLVGAPGYAAYGASKYAVRGYTDTLRLEMKLKGILVSIVYPSDVDTPQLSFENRFKPALTIEMEKIMGIAKPGKADVVAHQVLDAASRGKYVILPGGDARFVYYLVNFLGTGVYPFMDVLLRLAKRRLEKQSPAQPPAAPR